MIIEYPDKIILKLRRNHYYHNGLGGRRDIFLIKCERVARVGGQVTAPPTHDGLAVTSRTGYQVMSTLLLDILEVQECCTY